MRASYDFIIIGAGSAGSVAAARLSEDPDRTVLLLEAGGEDRSLLIRMPLAFRILRQKMLFDWGYASEEEIHAGKRNIPAPRGKVVGGSSSINGMMYSRGHPRDYDQWSQMGATGWSFDELLPFFRKSESNERGASHWHGADGPMAVSRMSADDPLVAATRESAVSLGLPLTEDFEAGSSEGVGLPDLTVSRGRRASAASAFLTPARKRPNLDIVTGAHAEKILFEGSRATTVRFRRKGASQTVHCTGEIVVSAGAFASPQLLMLSGIGPADHLREHGIDVLADLPGVGANLQDHPLVPMGFRGAKPFPLRAQLRADRVALSAARWLFTGGGMMGSQPLSAIAYYRSREGIERPDLESMIMPTSLDAKVWFPGVRKPTDDMLTVLNCVLRPSSRGSVRLRGPDPSLSPAIQFNLLETEEDIALLRYSVAWTRNLMARQPIADYVAGEVFPAAMGETPEKLDDYIRSTVVTAQHPACTCRMGGDPMSVVAPDLRVHGFENLRIADASVMPALIGGHTNAPCIMIGERVAEFISS
tara:strand:- start:1425 stop:3023 length:1599 start_codon:yes stop_codon:yes gene_type:complete